MLYKDITVIYKDITAGATGISHLCLSSENDFQDTLTML